MKSFLEEVADQTLQLPSAPGNLIYVLPSKRAGSFLKAILARKIQKATFAPTIYSIEGFVEKIAGISFASNTRLLFELYKAYLSTTTEPDNFHDFCKWGQTLLQDFNEIDRYLVPADALFAHLADIKRIEHWAADAEPTPLIKNYLRFWHALPPLYKTFRKQLRDEGSGYQGMVYRLACEELDAYLETVAGKSHIFLGFNALNKAEAQIIQQILEKTHAKIYWDLDRYFLEDPVHDAGYFIRQHSRNWPVLKQQPLAGISDHYVTPKKIRIAGVPKNVTQVKYVGNILQDLSASGDNSLGRTAVVLGDESLLNPLIHSLPESIGPVNITMGYPLAHSPMEGLFTRFFELYLHREGTGWFYRNVIALLSHPYLEPLLTEGKIKQGEVLIRQIREKNWIYPGIRQLTGRPESRGRILELLFSESQPDPIQFIARCRDLVLLLKAHFEKDPSPVVLEQLYRFYTLFNQLQEYVETYPFVGDLRTLLSLYKSLVHSESVDFRGEPLEGLQLMGMLESRNLDFETVILTSLNEGILPAGKSGNSFLPYDLKREFGLPTHKEKDAVYTYHFYRLLQRATTIHMLYNTEADVLEGGERSRLVSQLITDPVLRPYVEQVVAAPGIALPPVRVARIEKDADIMERLRVRAQKGFSPTSLTRYIRNPLEFYKQTILGIDETEEVDESISNQVFGTVIHGAMEELYAPFLGQELRAEDLKSSRRRIRELVHQNFLKAYEGLEIEKGKNLIALRVLERYMERMVEMEIRTLERERISLLGLEKDLSIAVTVPGLDFPVRLRGIIDRVDRVDGRLRIIDYKSGRVESREVEMEHWDDLATNADKGKAFQLLSYALMYSESEGAEALEAGIISFKNLSQGVIPFAWRDREAKSRDFRIGPEVLTHFREQLGQLLRELFNPAEPFLEKKA